jgi:hypothetical protein
VLVVGIVFALSESSLEMESNVAISYSLVIFMVPIITITTGSKWKAKTTK